MNEEFKNRIDLNTDLSNISKIICNEYNIGDFLKDEVITVGYEDFNYILTTTTGKYCIKIFNKYRTDNDCKKYIDRIILANKSKINTPKICKTKDGYQCVITINDVKYRLCLFEYIDGKSFFDLKEIPSDEEIKNIVEQMANIHKQKLDSDFIYDKWAIINFIEEFNDKQICLNEEDYTVLNKLKKEFENIDIKRLIYAFTHGDIISTNVMKDLNDKLWIIDFAVSNYLPRIVDLAVTACNLCLNPNDKDETINKIKLIINEYEKYNKLTDYEKEALPVFFNIGNAMGILQISYLMSNSDINDEDKFWYNVSKMGIEFSNNEFWEKIYKEEV